MNKESFIGRVAPAAQANMREFGILASVTLAQAILESGWGSHAPGNNLFGIKGSGQLLATQEFINGRWVQIVDGFCVYESWYESIRDHSYFLSQNYRYANVLNELDYRLACQKLQHAGYATDPLYADKLIRIIEGSDLTRFDQIEEKGEYIMSTDDANKIITFLSAAWSSTEDMEARAEFHRLANELRKASGQQ
ncbi:mannosyl-glycoprotein endo-beta-N-acetylglucosamidase [Paenibacillus sp. 5J-6]|uniref:Mannosyl-glycoprotein endo-beta-N-acetylglucosamidase n=1 Tax=Paenibacillus silvestris TaxID=2606219 RepID=A0A6L8V1K8_9BACL|nr:glycoside hydrolase family 73 protein [Paenibacillus silvestris]MZQ83602.1 mannosyl-glycoprotein endo-beta-N-acetylglucosamidase [Paenibacillus silvestris]